MTETKIRKTQIEGEPFDEASGHRHTGAAGDGRPIALNGLSDVNAPAPTDGQVLSYDDASSTWIPADSTGGSGGGGTRGTTSITTGSLDAGATDSSQKFTLGKLCSVIKLVTDKPAWVRVYSKPSYQSADSGRGQTSDPAGEHGVLLECITTSGNLELDLAPAAMIYSLDGAQTTQVNVTVKNLDSTAGAITVTLTSVGLEA